MKYIHFPTLLMHLGLAVFAALTINDYHDGFLLIADVILLAHIIWAARSKHSMLPAHLFGCALQFAAFHLDVIDVNSGSFGLGGGEFALFFYEIALAISCAIELVIALVKHFTQKHLSQTK